MGNKASSSSSSEDISDRTENDGANGSNPGHRHTIESDTNVDEPEAPSQSYYSMIKQSYQALVHAIIRPPRCEYDYHQLGPKNFEFGQRRFVRNDFTLRNLRGQQICCSLWEPIGSHRPSPMLPCVIYMHGNSSARLEALSSLSLVLSLGATMLAFDFSGSGLSEGEYVSLGYYEKDDLQCVIEHLRGGGTTSTIALWGRSMGAATALLHGERDPSIASMVLDSAFASLVQLAEEMVEMGRQQGLFAPGILVRLVLSFVRGSVQRAAQFDIRALRPIESADKCFIPAMFVAAENDHFVSQQHSVLLHDKYGGDKNLVIVDGDHNTPRPRFLYDSIGIFLSSTLQIPEEWMLVDCEVFMRRVPWAAVPPSFAAAPSFFSTSTTSRPPAPASTTTTMNASSTTSSSTNNSNRNRRRRNGGSGADDAGAMGDDDAAQAYMEAYRRASELNNMYQQQQQQQQQSSLTADGTAIGGEMSYEDLLAISLMLNEEEDQEQGQAGATAGATAGAGAPGGAAELAMQSQIQQSLFGLMGGSNSTSSTPATTAAAATATTRTTAGGANNHENSSGNSSNSNDTINDVDSASVTATGTARSKLDDQI